MSPEKLVYMANQIGKFFAAQGAEKAKENDPKAIAAIADHLRKFWDPRMRAAILAHLAAGGNGLDPLVRCAIKDMEAAATSHS